MARSGNQNRRDEHVPLDPTRRGYSAVYRHDEINHCPGCGRTHWYVGRISAECGFCGTALPLAGHSWGGRSTAWRTIVQGVRLA